MANRLMIGAGCMRRPGWKTLDASPDSGADIICTIPPLPPEVREFIWDEIEMIHVLEHFYLWDARYLLREIHAVLAPDGLLVIEAPNILYAAKILCGIEAKPSNAAEGQFDMWPFYGSPLKQNPLMGHRWGYTPTSLCEELQLAGFASGKIQVQRAKFHIPVRDFRVVAKK